MVRDNEMPYKDTYQVQNCSSQRHLPQTPSGKGSTCVQTASVAELTSDDSTDDDADSEGSAVAVLEAPLAPASDPEGSAEPTIVKSSEPDADADPELTGTVTTVVYGTAAIVTVAFVVIWSAVRFRPSTGVASGTSVVMG